MNRVIFLVDMNAFFISCELTRRPELREKPSAVAGDPKKRTGIILAANYEARKSGVKTAMVIHEALKLCPGLNLVPPDHTFYEKKSREVMDILSCYTPLLEQNSIDEAWLDMTGCEELFGAPQKSAANIMERIKNELGLWCSIGISENKFLSKMASEMKKPLGITELFVKDIEFKLWPLPVENMYGIGRQTANKLYDMGIFTIGELARFNPQHLKDKLGKSGAEIHLRANGIDAAPVVPHSNNDMKSIGRSLTFARDVLDIEDAKSKIMELSEEVGMTARKYGKKGRTVQITIKYSDFKVITRQATIPATYLSKDIASTGIELMKRNWDNKRPVRLLGISLCGFGEDLAADQVSIFNMTETNLKNDREEKLEKAMDKIREKFGTSKISRAVLLKRDEVPKD